MAYLIYGEKRPLVYLANFRVGSTSTAKAIMDHGGEQQGHHHDQPTFIPDNAIVCHTVRHHCDVMVSYWFKKASGQPFDKFVELVLEGNHPYLSSDGFYQRWGDTPNRVLRYETLSEDWSEVCEEVGLDAKDLVQSNSKRPKGISWHLLYRPNLYERVAATFKHEMEKYGYGRS